MSINTQQVAETSDITEQDVSGIREGLLILAARAAIGVGDSGRKVNIDPKARAWVFNGDKKLPFSFERCCAEFGADPEKVRDWLLWYQKRYGE